MGKFVNKDFLDSKLYDMVDEDGFKKLLGMGKILKFENISFNSSGTSSETFFDTPQDMLAKTGVLLSKVQEKGKTYIKIQKQSFVPQTFRTIEDTIYVHEIGSRDKILDHSLYLIDGISTLLATSFSIDLENVLKTIIPRLEITTNFNTFRLVSGTGFRANLIQENMLFKNLVTKRKVKKPCLRIENISPETYKPQYDALVELIERKCVGLLPITESTFDYATRLTKKLEENVTKKKDKKDKKALNRIEG